MPSPVHLIQCLQHAAPDSFARGSPWPQYPRKRIRRLTAAASEMGRVEMWRGGGRPNISVAASFVWRCLSGSTVTPFPHPAHRTGHADLPHPALGQDFTPFRV